MASPGRDASPSPHLRGPACEPGPGAPRVGWFPGAQQDDFCVLVTTVPGRCHLLFGPYVFVTETGQMPRKATGDFAFSPSWETDQYEDFSAPHGRMTPGHGQSAVPRVLGHGRRGGRPGNTVTGRRGAPVSRSQPCARDIRTCGAQKKRAHAGTRGHTRSRAAGRGRPRASGLSPGLIDAIGCVRKNRRLLPGLVEAKGDRRRAWA